GGGPRGGRRRRSRRGGGRAPLPAGRLGAAPPRRERGARAAVDRYRGAARRSFARKLGELPGHAFVEICVLALEKIGVGQLRALRRAGVPGGESHFSGVLRTAHPGGRLGAPSDNNLGGRSSDAASSAGDDLRLAIVIRRD